MKIVEEQTDNSSDLKLSVVIHRKKYQSCDAGSTNSREDEKYLKIPKRDNLTFIEEKKQDILKTQSLIEKFKKLSTANKKFLEKASQKSLPSTPENLKQKTQSNKIGLETPSKQPRATFLDRNYTKKVKTTLKEGAFITCLPPRYDKSLSPLTNVAVISNVKTELAKEEHLMETNHKRMEKREKRYEGSELKQRTLIKYAADGTLLEDTDSSPHLFESNGSNGSNFNSLKDTKETFEEGSAKSYSGSQCKSKFKLQVSPTKKKCSSEYSN